MKVSVVAVCVTLLCLNACGAIQLDPLAELLPQAASGPSVVTRLPFIDPRFDPRLPEPCYPAPCVSNPYDPWGLNPRYGAYAKLDSVLDSASELAGGASNGNNDDGGVQTTSTTTSTTTTSSSSSSSSSSSGSGGGGSTNANASGSNAGAAGINSNNKIDGSSSSTSTTGNTENGSAGGSSSSSSSSSADGGVIDEANSAFAGVKCPACEEHKKCKAQKRRHCSPPPPTCNCDDGVRVIVTAPHTGLVEATVVSDFGGVSGAGTPAPVTFTEGNSGDSKTGKATGGISLASPDGSRGGGIDLPPPPMEGTDSDNDNQVFLETNVVMSTLNAPAAAPATAGGDDDDDDDDQEEDDCGKEESKPSCKNRLPRQQCPCACQNQPKCGCSCNGGGGTQTPVLAAPPGSGSSGSTNAELDAEVSEDMQKSKELSDKIKKKEDLLAAKEQWLQQAQMAYTKLARQIKEVNQTKADLEDELEDLLDQKALVRKKEQRDALERDLKEANGSLDKLNSQQRGLMAKRLLIGKSADEVQKKVNELHTRLTQAVGKFEKMANGKLV